MREHACADLFATRWGNSTGVALDTGHFVSEASKVSQAITVAARAGFAAVHHIEERLRGIDFPIELALPCRYSWWQDLEPHLDEVHAKLSNCRLAVATMHATQARLTEPDILVWGKQTIGIAELLGAKVVTLHPNWGRKDKNNQQHIARSFLQELSSGTSVSLSIETFQGRQHLFKPEEIMEAGLPMTLDTAHISDHRRIMKITDDYWPHIPVVHLSARDGKENHLPADDFCFRVVRRLVDLGWVGAIVLEYLPHHHYRLRPDLDLVRQALHRVIKPGEILPPCNVYKGRREMWGYDAPESTRDHPVKGP